MKTKSTISRADIIRALRMPEECAEDLCAEARRLRQDVFGDTVFLYGFIYASTYCRNSCLFCNSRLENSELQRYRKNPAEVLELAEAAAQSGVHLLDITSGEDPGFTGGDAGSLFRAVRKRTGLPIMASLGLADGAMAEALRDADWYACYQETHNRQLFARMRPGQDYDRRLNSKVAARRNGLLVEEGIMTGIGETDDDIADSIEAMAELDADQVRVMSHVPQPGSALAGLAPPPSIRERVIIAILRLSFPDRLIPASLDVAGLAGLCERLDAGANVVTSIIPPGSGLAGVANRSLDIENGGRTIRAVRSVLAECGLRAAGQDEYRDWIRNRKAGRS